MAPRLPRPVGFGFRKGFAFNLVCGAYFLLLSPYVTAAARAGISEEAGTPAPAVWLGILLIAAMTLETVSLPEKMRFARRSVADRQEGDASSAGLFFLWMFHCVIAILVLFHAAAQFGVDLAAKEGDPQPPAWVLLFIPLVVIKELYLLTSIWLGKAPEASAARYSRPSPREWFHDLVLIIYACIASSVTWGLVSGRPLDPSDPVKMIVNGVAATLVFLIFYLPMRIPYWYEEWMQVRQGRDVVRFVLSLLSVLVPALWALG